MSIYKVCEFIGPKCTAKVFKDSEYGEFVVRFHYPAPIGYVHEADYFTNDKDDAIGVAKLEAGA